MTKSVFYLDTEFSAFEGELLSLALVPEDKTKPSFYVQFTPTGPIDPWVVQHVVPFIGNAVLVTRHQAAQMLVGYFNGENPHVIADWPEDIMHLTKLLITGPGKMVPIQGMTFRYRNFHGFSTATASAIPHNALEDAKALRRYATFEDLIGITVEDIPNTLVGRGIRDIRVTIKDGNALMGTMDYRLNRLNVSVDDGKISGIIGIG